MKVIKPSYEIEEIHGHSVLMRIAYAGALCYKNEGEIKTLEDAKNFIRKRIKQGHESIIEHEKVTVKVICDRGVTHEIVRHRIGSYSQESTRYCNYSKSRFGGEIKVIDLRKQLNKSLREKGMHSGGISFVVGEWEEAMKNAERHYNRMIELGCTPEFARSVLPNSLKTEILMTYNLRQWRHFFKLRAQNKRAHPQLREITIPMLKDFQKLIPVIFDDIEAEW